MSTLSAPLVLLLITFGTIAALSIKHKIVRGEETGAFYLIVSNGVKRHIPDDFTLRTLMSDEMTLERGEIAAISEDLLSYFVLDRSMPSLTMRNPYPDEKMRTFIQHFEIMQYPWFWLETYKLPGCFNPSIVRWNNASLISWRGGVETDTFLKFGWMSDDFSRVEENQDYLGISAGRDHVIHKMPFNHTEEDPRMLVMSDNSLMVSYVGCMDDCPADTFNTSILYFVVRLNKKTGMADFGRSIMLDWTDMEEPEEYNYYHGQRTVKQKNWVPFEYNKGLYFVHTFYPMHVITVVGKDKRNFGVMKTVVKQTERIPLPWKKVNGWPIRGGTPAILVQGVYLTFFHAVVKKSKRQERLTYVMGALTFCPHPPFNILSMSSLPIAKQLLYDGRWAAPDIFYVVFPAGLQLSEDQQHIFVSLGHQDVDGFVLKMEVEGLLNSLVTFGTCDEKSYTYKPLSSVAGSVMSDVAVQEQ